MKDFEDFIKYVHENGNEIHSSIHQNVLTAINKQHFEDIAKNRNFIIVRGSKLVLWKCWSITIIG